MVKKWKLDSRIKDFSSTVVAFVKKERKNKTGNNSNVCLRRKMDVFSRKRVWKRKALAGVAPNAIGGNWIGLWWHLWQPW